MKGLSTIKSQHPNGPFWYMVSWHCLFGATHTMVIHAETSKPKLSTISSNSASIVWKQGSHSWHHGVFTIHGFNPFQLKSLENDNFHKPNQLSDDIDLQCVTHDNSHLVWSCFEPIFLVSLSKSSLGQPFLGQLIKILQSVLSTQSRDAKTLSDPQNQGRSKSNTFKTPKTAEDRASGLLVKAQTNQSLWMALCAQKPECVWHERSVTFKLVGGSVEHSSESAFERTGQAVWENGDSLWWVLIGAESDDNER